MDKNLIIAIVLFGIAMFTYWKVTNGPLKKLYGDKTMKNWVTQTYYWQAAVFYSTGVTFVIMYVLRAFDLL